VSAEAKLQSSVEELQKTVEAKQQQIVQLQHGPPKAIIPPDVSAKVRRCHNHIQRRNECSRDTFFRTRSPPQMALLERQNHELEAQVARANVDLAELGQLLQERSAEATEAAQRLTEVETELARLKMERALQAGRSPYSPNVSFQGDASAMPSAVPSEAVSTPGLLTSPMRRPPVSTPSSAKPLAEQMQSAQVVITAPSDDAVTISVGSDHDAVVPNLDTSMLSVSIAQHLSTVSAGRGESAMDMSYDEEWRIADNAYISLNDRIRKLEALRNTLDQRLRKGAASGQRRRRRVQRGLWALTAEAH